MLMETPQERLIVCIGAVPAAEYLLEMTIQYCKERTAFGRRSRNFRTRNSRSWRWPRSQAGQDFPRQADHGPQEGKNIVVEVSMAKYWMTEMAMRVADQCLQLHGGYGYCRITLLHGLAGSQGDADLRWHQRNNEGDSCKVYGALVGLRSICRGRCLLRPYSGFRRGVIVPARTDRAQSVAPEPCEPEQYPRERAGLVPAHKGNHKGHPTYPNAS